MASELYDKGMKIRREVMGDDYVDRALASVDDFNREFQQMVTEHMSTSTMLTCVFSSSLDQKTGAALAATRWRSAITADSCPGKVRRWCPGRSCETHYSLN